MIFNPENYPAAPDWLAKDEYDIDAVPDVEVDRSDNSLAADEPDEGDGQNSGHIASSLHLDRGTAGATCLRIAAWEEWSKVDEERRGLGRDANPGIQEARRVQRQIMRPCRFCQVHATGRIGQTHSR